MKKIVRTFALLAALLAPLGAFAQSNPGLRTGQVPTAAQWNSYFSAKQDYLGFPPLSANNIVGTSPIVVTPSGGVINISCPTCGSGSGLAIGTSPITSGTSTRVLFDNAGILGEYPITGTGSVAMGTSPTITTPTLTNPSITIFGAGFFLGSDAGFTLENNVTPTKKMVFDLSAVAPATTRTLSVADANGTIITSAVAPTLTLKHPSSGNFIGSGCPTATPVHNILWSDQNACISADAWFFISTDPSAGFTVTISGTVTLNDTIDLIFTFGSGTCVAGAVPACRARYTAGQGGDPLTLQAVANGLACAIANNTNLFDLNGQTCTSGAISGTDYGGYASKQFGWVGGQAGTNAFTADFDARVAMKATSAVGGLATEIVTINTAGCATACTIALDGAPGLVFGRNAGVAPSPNSDIFNLYVIGATSASPSVMTVNYGAMQMQVLSSTASALSSAWVFQTTNTAGTNWGSTWSIGPGGIYDGNATDKGNGTLNVSDSACGYYVNGSCAFAASILTARTYYVRSAGSDANCDGRTNVNDPGSGALPRACAFATPNKAINTISVLNTNGLANTIQIGCTTPPCTFTSASEQIVLRPLAGGGTVNIVGDTTTPSNVVIAQTGGQGAVFGNNLGFGWLVGGIKMTNTSGACISIAGISNLLLSGKVEYGACVNGHILATRGAVFDSSAQQSIVSGDGDSHWKAFTGGQIVDAGSTITFSGTRTFASGFAQSSLGGSVISAQGNTFAGTFASVVGTKWATSNGGGIFTATGSSTYLPGTGCATIPTCATSPGWYF